MNCEKAIKNIREMFKLYLIQNRNLKSVVLGVSGGIDSALVAALARPVCKEMGVRLIGMSLPSGTNKQDETDRADKILSSFFDEPSRSVRNIDQLFREFVQLNILFGFSGSSSTEAEKKKDKIRFGNIKARTRMTLLYDEAQGNDGMVLSTDNYTELLLGFWTLHGDVGDYGMIQNLWKTEVYEIAQYLCHSGELKGEEALALQACIDAVPTDGLGITNSDLDQLGAPTYEEVDKILKKLLDRISDKGYDRLALEEPEFVNHPVVRRNRATEFKRKNPINISRDLIIDKEDEK